MALVVLDASIVIGFLDPEDALHDACVAALLQYQAAQRVDEPEAHGRLVLACGDEVEADVILTGDGPGRRSASA